MSDRLTVIGLTGVAGSGKDTAAGIMCHRHGFFRIALADGIRAAFRDIDGITWGLTKELEKAGLTNRWALQRIGGNAREKIAEIAHLNSPYDDEDEARNGVNRFWLYLALTKIVYLHSIHPVPRNRFAVPDISHEHEIDCFKSIIRELGGTYRTWRVDRAAAGLSGEAAQHASEVGRATVPSDLTIRNDGTVEELEKSVGLACADLLATDA